MAGVGVEHLDVAFGVVGLAPYVASRGNDLKVTTGCDPRRSICNLIGSEQWFVCGNLRRFAIIHLLNWTKYAAVLVDPHMFTAEDSQRAAWLERLRQLGITDHRVDPMKGCGREGEIEGFDLHRPLLEGANIDRYIWIWEQVAPSDGGHLHSELHTLDTIAAPRKRHGRLPRPAADLQDATLRGDTAQLNHSVKQRFRIARTHLIIQLRDLVESYAKAFVIRRHTVTPS